MKLGVMELDIASVEDGLEECNELMVVMFGILRNVAGEEYEKDE